MLVARRRASPSPSVGGDAATAAGMATPRAQPYGLTAATWGSVNGSVRCTTPSSYNLSIAVSEKPQHMRENVGRVVADRRRAAPDSAGGQRHLRHHAVDADRDTRLPVQHRHGHLARRVMRVVVLVTHVEDAGEQPSRAAFISVSTSILVRAAQ